MTHFWRFLKRDERTVGENVSSLVVKWLRVYFAATAGGDHYLQERNHDVVLIVG